MAKNRNSLIATGAALCFALGLAAQSTSRSFVEVSVVDASNAALPGSNVRVECAAARFQAGGVTGAAGTYRFLLVPFAPCQVLASAANFNPVRQNVNVGPGGAKLTVRLALAGTKSEILVSGDLLDRPDPNPSASAKLDRDLIAKLPNQSTNSSFSSLLTLSVAGISGDANGVFHVLGEHAEASFSVDNQPISDQQSRIFSNQLSLGAIQSVEVINGSPPAEFGDKTSVIVQTTTRSGLGFRKPAGAVSAGYNSYGTPQGSFAIGYGGDHFGNFLTVDGLTSGRFLDTPEISPLHARGNVVNLFERFDYQPGTADAFHLNLTLARSWFQVPNDYDQQFSGQDQRQQTKSFNLAPSYTHIFNPKALVETNLWVRQDRSGYFPSRDLFADRPAFLSQSRRLTNAGGRSAFSFANGIQTLKTGIDIHYTALSERFQTGITDRNFNPPCLASPGVPAITPIATPELCIAAGFQPNDQFLPSLLPVDLTRGGSLFRFQGKAGILQQSGFVQDSIRLGALTLNPGLRFDNYNGIGGGHLLQPRLGASYQIGKTASVVRISYARIFLTPYNENLVLASSNGPGSVGGALGSLGASPLQPAYRNQYNVGLQQAFGKWLSVDGEYFWKYTKGAYDFDVILNTPLNFPVQFKKSKIDGVLVRLAMPEHRGLTAFTVLGHSRSRLFGPETGGVSFSAPYSAVVRPDHDQAFQQTTHIRYQFRKNGPWSALTWRYESGLVAVAIQDYATALGLTAGQQAQMGLHCGDNFATTFTAIRTCDEALLGSTRLRIPRTGLQNDDTNPSRIAPRNTFDLGLGHDNLLHTEAYKLRLRFNIMNATGKHALYNFLSSFSGTHFILPRSYQAEIGITY